ncbi:hypothetical protein [Goodfellowiella coeruleoviolacea]|uniref:Uncharacterized protein n=1 Tax=Goodfellowiella coeruleoviolacea TaxID=334858 RepID=A0AAE3GL37_9PSEU|nr:hypothetical protein [Goodfellowiella coeruleoviolacea]MCP2168043.1 hypothetical protein [Goodfellowiella coeruleoviolacea]
MSEPVGLLAALSAHLREPPVDASPLHREIARYERRVEVMQRVVEHGSAEDAELARQLALGARAAAEHLRTYLGG